MGFVKGALFRIIKRVAGMLQLRLKNSSNDVVIREDVFKDISDTKDTVGNRDETKTNIYGDDDYTESNEAYDVELTNGIMYTIGSGFSLTPKASLEVSFASHTGGITLSPTDLADYYGLEEVKGKVAYTRINLGLVINL